MKQDIVSVVIVALIFAITLMVLTNIEQQNTSDVVDNNLPNEIPEDILFDVEEFYPCECEYNPEYECQYKDECLCEKEEFYPCECDIKELKRLDEPSEEKLIIEYQQDAFRDAFL